MPATFEQLLQEYSQRAETYLNVIRSCPSEQRSHVFLCSQLQGYVCSKFMLEPGECNSKVLVELSAASIAKVVQLPQGQLSKQDLSMNCAGISSVEAKKILLLIALQRSLGIQIDPDLTPEIQTVDDLAALIKSTPEQQQV